MKRAEKPNFRNEPMRPHFDLAIERAYAAAMGDVSWHEALSAATRALAAQGAMLFTPELAREAGGLAVSHDASAQRHGLRAVSPEDQSSPPLSNRAYSTVLSDGGDATLPRALFVVFRAESGSPLTAEEREAIDVFSTHLSRAVRLWYREHLSRHGAEVLANSLLAGAFISDSDARIAWKNAASEQWIKDGKVVVANGRLLGLPGFSIDLPRVIRDIAERRAEATVVAAGEVALEILPLSVTSADRVPSGGSALLILRDRTGCRQAAAALAANFRLTASEVDLAMALAKGVLIGEYATQKSVAMSTVRTQLKSLLAKMRARRQSDVVSIVARLHPIAGPVMADSSYAARDAHPTRNSSNG
jgi:DNA-binding CsgD family transcriptional regulator